MSIKEIISIADKVAGSKAVKAGKWGILGIIITGLSTYGPIINDKINHFVEALQAADSVEVYKVQITEALDQLRTAQKYNKEGQDTVNKGLDRRIDELGQRELSKDYPLLAEMDKTDTSGAILYSSNEGDLWHYHRGWTHQAIFSRSDKGFYYRNNANKRIEIR